MIYQITVNTPKNTPINSPQRVSLKVTRGLVYRIEVEFPPGPSGLLHCMITDGSFQLWPSTPGEWFATDGNVIGFEDLYLKEASPFEFSVYTYNESDHEDHLVMIRVGLVSKEAFMARFMPSLSWKEYIEWYDKMKEEQQEVMEAVLAAPFPWLLEE